MVSYWYKILYNITLITLDVFQYKIPPLILANPYIYFKLSIPASFGAKWFGVIQNVVSSELWHNLWDMVHVTLWNRARRGFIGTFFMVVHFKTTYLGFS